ncbi:hypothetical protein BGZ65_005868, partial [Modicella reniformis]
QNFGMENFGSFLTRLMRDFVVPLSRRPHYTGLLHVAESDASQDVVRILLREPVTS